jgi:hypothetical protein
MKAALGSFSWGFDGARSLFDNEKNDQDLNSEGRIAFSYCGHLKGLTCEGPRVYQTLVGGGRCCPKEILRNSLAERGIRT